MLVVKIELHSAVTGEITTIATGTIVNTGTGTPTSGDYRVELKDAIGRRWKKGQITGFPRKRLSAWDLLYRVLEKLVKRRNPTRDLPAVSDVHDERQHNQPRDNTNEDATAQPGPDSEVP
jgi:hypothetical protein